MKKTGFGELFRRWDMTSVKLNMKFAEVEFQASDDDITAAWEMYVELLTRVATQRIDDCQGDEIAALDSIYALFDITRNVLKEKGRNAQNFTKIAIIVLNQVIRPFTSKWHKRKNMGALSTEEDCIEFRKDLVELQTELIKYAGMLSEMAMVENLIDILDEE